jgi:hypothetical protein
VRRGPGRPKSAAPKEQISVRLDQDVLAKLREAGPGWQSQVNALLRQALPCFAVNCSGEASAPHYQPPRDEAGTRDAGARRAWVSAISKFRLLFSRYFLLNRTILFPSFDAP